MKVYVNEVELDLPTGTSAIDAVFAAGYDVPYFCSQEYMSPIGACRMCLAKVGAPRKDRETNDWIKNEDGSPQIFYFPNMMATCTTAIMEGMVIDTLSPEVKQAQAGMVEFTLINHPLDCPTCDKGGACELQDRAYEYGEGRSRFVFDKRHQEKHHALSELITLDRERCIHCKRCVRYFEEVPGDEVLDFIERGVHTYIATAADGLPSHFSGNITDICPVGALLDATSRFRGRNWEYDHTRTTSTQDASGAAIMVDARTGRIERIKAARNTQVNLDWIDDSTRFGHEYVSAPDRLRHPLVKRGGSLQKASWDEAMALIREKLAAHQDQAAALLYRSDSTLEEAVAARALAEVLQGPLAHFPRPAASVVAKNPATFTDVATSDAIFVVGDPSEELPILDLRIKDALKGVAPPELLPHGVPIADLRLKERMPRKREMLTVAAPYRTDLMKHAGAVLSYAPGHEAHLFDGLQKGRTPRGMDGKALKALDARLKVAESAVIVLGGAVLASSKATAAAEAYAAAVGAKVMKLAPMANSCGLESLAFHAPTSEQGLLEESRLLFISNLNPAANADYQALLANKDLLVVHSAFENETTALADVVLPAKTGFEKEGTVVNVEGRYLPLFPAPVDSGASEDLLGVARNLGTALGARLSGRSVRSARRALASELELDLAQLPAEGEVRPLSAQPSEKQPVKAVTGNLLLVPTYLGLEQLGRNPKLQQAHGGLSLRVHPEDAGKHALKEGAAVSVEVNGSLRPATVRLTEAAPKGTLLLSALRGEALVLHDAKLHLAAEEVVA